MPIIYHIATADDWHRAVKDGEYTTSTIGRTLAEEGFLHASTASQVSRVANTYYRDVPGDLVLLVIDTALLASPLRYDDVPGHDQPFPHIYGPLNTGAVIETVPVTPGPDGTYAIEPQAAGRASPPVADAEPLQAGAAEPAVGVEALEQCPRVGEPRVQPRQLAGRDVGDLPPVRPGVVGRQCRLDARQYRVDLLGALAPGEVDRQRRALVGAAQPEPVRRRWRGSRRPAARA